VTPVSAPGSDAPPDAAVRAPIRVVERDVGVVERDLLAHTREMGVDVLLEVGIEAVEFEAIGPAPPGA
jgi:hypothetical protein